MFFDPNFEAKRNQKKYRNFILLFFFLLHLRPKTYCILYRVMHIFTIKLKTCYLFYIFLFKKYMCISGGFFRNNFWGLFRYIFKSEKFENFYSKRKEKKYRPFILPFQVTKLLFVIKILKFEKKIIWIKYFSYTNLLISTFKIEKKMIWTRSWFKLFWEKLTTNGKVTFFLPLPPQALP